MRIPGFTASVALFEKSTNPKVHSYQASVLQPTVLPQQEEQQAQPDSSEPIADYVQCAENCCRNAGGVWDDYGCACGNMDYTFGQKIGCAGYYLACATACLRRL